MKNEIKRLFPKHIRMLIEKQIHSPVYEIRVRINRPICVRTDRKEEFLESIHGKLYVVTKQDITELISNISHHSYFAYENEMRQGYITIEGGHRIGISGQVICENGSVKNMRYISSIHIRIAHEILGCSLKILPLLLSDHSIYNTLLISPPGCGKTTLLRDLVYQLSEGTSMRKGYQVAVIDERSEIAGCYQGIAQNLIGKRTDVMDGCPKALGVLMMIRSMGPEIVVVDELGGSEDFLAIQNASHCGVNVLASIHGNTVSDFQAKMRKECCFMEKFFQRIIVLKERGKIEGIYDETGNRVKERLCGS